MLFNADGASNISDGQLGGEQLAGFIHSQTIYILDGGTAEHRMESSDKIIRMIVDQSGQMVDGHLLLQVFFDIVKNLAHFASGGGGNIRLMNAVL